VALISHDEILRYEEILTVVRVAAEIGVRKIRITGGEPLVRRGVLEFLAKLHEIDAIEDIGLTTNGTLLPSMAQALRDAGLTRLNISLDSLRRDTFKAITGSDNLDDVLAGIRRALRAGFSPVKINVVLLQGINEEDIPSFAQLTMDNPLDIRFIERMPFGTESLPKSPDSFSARKALELVQRKFGELVPIERNSMDGPATMFRLKEAQGRIGIIDPITGHFCGTCNRLRLTARGTLRPCLLGNREIDIKTPLRKGASDQELAEIIRAAVLAKPVGNQSRLAAINDGMNMIGG